MLYVGAVFTFVLSQKVGNEAAEAQAVEVQEHGQPD
jgi:hypothetical protein